VFFAVAAFVLWWSMRPEYDVDYARRECLRLRTLLDGANREKHLEAALGASRHYPDLPDADLLWGIARKYSTPHAAIAKLEFDRERAPAAWWLHAGLAELNEQIGRPQKAAEHLKIVDHVAPDTAEAWYLRSFAAFDCQRALSFAEEAVNCDPNHVLSWIRLANLREHLGDAEGAMAAADHLAEIDVEIGGARWLLFKGDIAATQHRFRKAIAIYTKAIEADPELMTAYRQRAHAYRRLGDYACAEADYSKGIQAIPDYSPYPWLHFHRATVRWILGHRVEAVDDCRRTHEIIARPTFADARMYIILQELDRTTEAEDEIQKAIRQARDLEDGSWLTSVLQCLSGEISAEELVSRGTDQGDDSERACEAYYYAGERCLLEGRVAEARHWFERCRATGIIFDQDVAPDPMTEYELAGWRLDQLRHETSPEP
jgi:tetratricopeptide (TPR) repeat protein